MTNVVKSLAVNIDRWRIPRRAQLIQLEGGILSAEQRDQSMKYASVQSARFPLLFLITTSNLGQKPACVSDLTGSGRHPQASTMSLDMMSRRWGKGGE